MWPKFANSSISMRAVFVISILWHTKIVLLILVRRFSAVVKGKLDKIFATEEKVT